MSELDGAKNYHMQVQVKPTFIQSFGGINFIHEYLNNIQFDDTVLYHLGPRSVVAEYSYAELIRQLFYTSCIGGDTLDECRILKEQLQDHPWMRIASPDTVEYAFQELRQPGCFIPTASGKQHQVNEHTGFNKLLVHLCQRSGLLTRQTGYVMDYDGHVIENTKKDNAITYKRSQGYYPVVCSINKLPVYLQNRNGNTPESYDQKTVIEKALRQCSSHQLTISCLRADASCYQKDLVTLLEKEQINYCIRAEMNESLRLALQDETDWTDVLINYQKAELCSIDHPVFGKQRRIVAYRKKVKGQLQFHQSDGYDYHAILTSDKTAEACSVIDFYHQRGCYGEHHFKELDYDFGWNKLPFDNMEMNTIYMYAMAVAYVLFNAVKKHCAAKLDFVKPAMQLKNFILHFVTLPARWIKTGRQWIVKLFTFKDYSPLWDS
jgi:Transposase DDE domain group 1